MNNRQKVTLLLAVLILFIGLLVGAVNNFPVSPSADHQAPDLKPAAGGWCGKACTDNPEPPPMVVAGGWCGKACTDLGPSTGG